MLWMEMMMMMNTFQKIRYRFKIYISIDTQEVFALWQWNLIIAFANEQISNSGSMDQTKVSLFDRMVVEYNKRNAVKLIRGHWLGVVGK
jgi:hypothetical protein